MLHREETGVTQSCELLNASLKRVNDLVLLKLLVLVNHFLVKHKHSHFLEEGECELA